uniref:Mce/MlaD domain-containing protein n=1 Tax=Schimmelmannia schousboei TaxID=173468 RepID=A0A1C9C8R6_9FLOR|nr:hypothetical protein Schim_081 [Schimmelmannia schousboei]AOM64762.1 hypothetical protein Schim_081 [Schimmelmannia schousboei]
MNIIRFSNLWKNLNNIIVLLIFILFTICIWLSINVKKKQGYTLFVEFNNAYGIKEGTYVTMRGINIGYIKKINIDINFITVLVHVKSSKIIIPKNSIIETNQIGLLNDTVIDIIPLNKINYYKSQNIDVFSQDCFKSKFLCHFDHIEGSRGLNYDDLVRAATRISQRFDDPNVFNLFYMFLQNSIEMSDEMIFITFDIANITSLLYYFLHNFLLNNI